MGEKAAEDLNKKDIEIKKEEKSCEENINLREEGRSFVVGIGASAGGLEALEQFFIAMPSDSGMSFVLIQHLSPDYKSLMQELLSKYTDMSVYRVKNGMEIKPDSVYLIPPKKIMTVFHNKLYLTDKDIHTLSLPIDIFFRSLAEDKGEKAIGIVLSGTGSDGTLGIRAIKEAGGMVMAQDETSARFDGMPRSAISSGFVDYVLSPEKMPDELLKYIKHPCISSPGRDETPIQEGHLPRILAIIRQNTGVDFTYYKQSTLIRRVERRLSINQVDEIEDYILLLQQSPYEVEILYKDFLIGVTNFFRDKEAFYIIKEKILPEIFRKKDNYEDVRFWVAASSTGEEAYSLAIMLQEFMDEYDKKFNIKIFATDIDKNAIEHASAGLYPESIAVDVSIDRLKRFFHKVGDKYKVCEKIRQMVIFARHNIVKDPPFHKIEFVSCRNMLIYMQPVLQKKILSYLNFALNKDGFLFLGPSETIGDLVDLYSTFDIKWKIYRTKNEGKRLLLDEMIVPVASRYERKSLSRKPALQGMTPEDEMIGDIQKKLLGDYVPPSIVVDENYNLVHTFGDISSYLSIPAGKVSLNVLTLVRQELSVILRTIIHKVIKENKKFVYKDVPLKGIDKGKSLKVIVYPFAGKEDKLRMFLVVFEEFLLSVSREALDEGIISKDVDQHILDLEQELQYTKENLQATIEELETSNEELQATNEELLAANEELQSTNEELQSVNEELITVNSEYQKKIEELTELNNDMINLLSSSDIGTIFLDKKLCIRKFTPAVTKVINLISQDTGRPISHISHNIVYDNFVEDIKSVLNTLKPVEKEVQNNKGYWYLVKILPYRTSENVVKGIVITFVEITEIIKAYGEIRDLSYVVEQSPSSIMITDPDSKIKYVNAAFIEQTGYTREELYGESYNTIKIIKPGKKNYNLIWKAVKSGKSWTGELQFKNKKGKLYWEEATILPVKNREGKIIHYLKVSEDITRRIYKARALKQSEEFLQAAIDLFPESIAILDEKGNIVKVNKAWNDFAISYNSEIEGVGKNYLEVCSSTFGEEEDKAKSALENIKALIAGEKEDFYMEYFCNINNKKSHFAMRGRKIEQNNEIRVLLAHENITEKK